MIVAVPIGKASELIPRMRVKNGFAVELVVMAAAVVNLGKSNFVLSPPPSGAFALSIDSMFASKD